MKDLAATVAAAVACYSVAAVAAGKSAAAHAALSFPVSGAGVAVSSARAQGAL